MSQSKRFVAVAFALCAIFLLSGLFSSSGAPSALRTATASTEAAIHQLKDSFGSAAKAVEEQERLIADTNKGPTRDFEAIRDTPPTRNFAEFKDLPAAHLEQFLVDGLAFASIYCSRATDFERDPSYAATQQQIWRILWSEFASKHPIVVFVCPFVRTEVRDALRGQGALVEEISLVKVPGESVENDMFAFLNIFGAVRYSRLAVFDSETFPIVNIDDGRHNPIVGVRLLTAIVFEVTVEQKCRYDELNMKDEILFFAQNEDDNDYALAGVRTVDATGNYTETGLLVLSPNVAQQKRLIRNTGLLTQKDVSLQTYLNSHHAFSRIGPFPFQAIDRVYGAGSAALNEVEAGVLAPSSVKVLRDKLWRGDSLIQGRKHMQDWQNIWSHDWGVMCERYNEPFFPKWRQLGRLPGFEELVAGVKDTAKEIEDSRHGFPESGTR